MFLFLVSIQHRSRASQLNSAANFDEILENISKIQQASQMKPNFVSPLPSSSPMQRSSDLLYLIIGIIAGVLLILILILFAMCVLRLLQQKKFISTLKE